MDANNQIAKMNIVKRQLLKQPPAELRIKTT